MKIRTFFKKKINIMGTNIQFSIMEDKKVKRSS